MTQDTLEELLKICTTECPFIHVDGNMFVQIDGVSMGSPLGVIFANFYMCHLENHVFNISPSLKPKLYCRYIDDCFLVLDDISQIDNLISVFENESVLKFTSEIGNNASLNFLDVHLEKFHDHFLTSVFY